jgi:hemolysin III
MWAMSEQSDRTGLEVPYWGRFDYTRAELIADGVVHGIGLLGAVSAGSILLAFAAFHAAPLEYAATLLYVVSLLAVLSISFAYNLWPISPAKWVLRRLDHAAIYLLIAGTYMPILAQLEDTSLALAMGILIWSSAVLGIAMKICLPGRFDRLSILIYLAMGWSGIVVVRKLVETLPSSSVWLIAAGGIAYSFGVIFFVWQRLRFQSAAWHSFVVLGAGFHLAAMMDFIVLERV